MAAKLSNEELVERLRAREAEQLEQLADHPNPAITVWRMLPGHNYGAVFETTKTGKLGKLLGYTIKNLVGTPKFMPVTVASRLIKDGKIEHGLIGDAWVRVNEHWRP